MANCLSAGVLIVGWLCSVIMAMRLSGARRRASTAAVSPAMPLPTITISARSTCFAIPGVFCLLIIQLGSMIVIHAPPASCLRADLRGLPETHRCRYANLHPGPEGDRKVYHCSPAGRSTHRLQRVHAYDAAYGLGRHGMSRCIGKRCIFPLP